jgi:hypothetical protein
MEIELQNLPEVTGPPDVEFQSPPKGATEKKLTDSTTNIDEETA